MKKELTVFFVVGIENRTKGSLELEVGTLI